MDEDSLLDFIADDEGCLMEVGVDCVQMMDNLRKSNQAVEKAGGLGAERAH